MSFVDRFEIIARNLPNIFILKRNSTRMLWEVARSTVEPLESHHQKNFVLKRISMELIRNCSGSLGDLCENPDLIFF